jgi:hypothetical protein
MDNHAMMSMLIVFALFVSRAKEKAIIAMAGPIFIQGRSATENGSIEKSL